MKSLKDITMVFIIAFFLISIALPGGKCLDISTRAIKARSSAPPPLGYDNQTAWDLGYTGKGIVIAVIDNGIDDNHESLEGKFITGVNFRIPGNPECNPDDTIGHGTACASIAMGTGGSEGKYMGVAPDAKLIDLKVKNSITGYPTEQSMIEAMEWCIAHKDTHWENQPPEYWGIDVISCSVGPGDYEDNGQHPLAQKANEVVEAGIVFVAAAGNMGAGTFDVPSNIDSPATADKVICVGNVDDNDTVDRSDDVIDIGSSAGPRLDDGDDDPYDELKPEISAPGVLVMSALFGTEDEYRERSGTSVSAPHVAGVAALMLQANPDLKPTADRNPIQEILRKTAESRGAKDSNLTYPDSDSYYNYSYGWGIVDAYEAVKAALAWEPPPEPNILPSISIASPENNAEVSGIITISGTALDTDGSVTNVELKIDEDNWFNISIVSGSSLTWNYSWNTKNVENGVHTIYAKAYDGMNYSGIKSVDVNVYNEASAGGVEEETKINPIYLISGAGIIGAVVIIVVCVLFFRRKKMHGAVSAVPPPVTGIPSVTAQCPTCGNIIKILSGKRPLKIRCSKCGARSILR